jgi:hypothetical protein
MLFFVYNVLKFFCLFFAVQDLNSGLLVALPYPQPFFALVIFQRGCQVFVWGWSQREIFISTASLIAGITDRYHPHLTYLLRWRSQLLFCLVWLQTMILLIDTSWIPGILAKSAFLDNIINTLFIFVIIHFA